MQHTAAYQGRRRPRVALIGGDRFTMGSGALPG